MTLPRPRPELALALVACLLLLAGDVFLYRQTLFLEAQLRGLTTLAPGVHMQPLAGLNNSYMPVVVNFGRRQRPTLLWLFLFGGLAAVGAAAVVAVNNSPQSCGACAAGCGSHCTCVGQPPVGQCTVIF